MSVRVLPQPTLSGPKKIQVGSSTYGVPQSAGVVSTHGGRIVYVLSAARVHAFAEAGQVEIPDELRHVVASHYFGARPR